MIIKNGCVFLRGSFQKTDISVIGGYIDATGDLTGDGMELDCRGLKVIPGLVDIHTHGRKGFSFNSAEDGGLSLLLGDYVMCGVTSVLATVMTDTKEKMNAACSRIGKMIGKGDTPVKGINIEGPFLSPGKKGAHDEKLLKDPSKELFEELCGDFKDDVRLVTVAPELNGAMEFIDNTAGVHKSLGHSTCGYETGMAAFGAGADHVTHAFNAMDGITGRKPGIVGAALDSNAYIEVICDGMHVSPSLLRMMIRTAPDRTVLISDSIAPAGMPDGEYISGGQTVIKRADMITVKDDAENATLAGSSISLFEGMRRCILNHGIKEEAAITAATFNPAASVGLEDRIGSIAPGLNADMAVVNDRYDIIHVISGGKMIF